MAEAQEDAPAVRGSRRLATRALELGAVASCLGYFSYGFLRNPSHLQDPLLLLWIVAIAAVDLMPVPTTLGLPFSLSFPLQLSVSMIYSPATAGLVGFLGSSDTREIRREIPFVKALWNRAQIAISIVGESVVFHHFAALKSPWYLLGLTALVAAVVGYSVNTLLVAFYFHLESRERVGRILREMHVGVVGEFILSYMGLALFSALVATSFVEIGPLSVGVLMAPLLFARQMFTRTHSLQEATVELAAKQQENEYQALHDALTDLPNRVLFQQRLREVIEGGGPDDRLAVMLMDLDHFKEINDTLGHHFGDELLKEIGPRLSTVLRDGDLMARLGGDEFGIILPHLPDEQVAVQIAERLLEELEQPLSVEGLALDVSGSIGIALYPLHSREVETLMRRADVAMYAAKETGGFEIYTPSMDQHSPHRLTLIGQVRPALENQEFLLHYQPKARLSDGHVTGVEALIRWEHPERGMVAPDQFIPLVERTVLLRPLTQYVLNEALRQWHQWDRAGFQLQVAVNLSPRSLLDMQLPDQVAQALARWNVPASSLMLELTESFLMADSGRSIGVLARLSDVGVKLSIDDFGTGYSSLSHLKRLPINEIKIDRSFVMNMADNSNDTMIVRATVDLGRNLSLQVVAEGVEDRATWEELAGMGCDLAQGFLLSKPLPALEMTKWLLMNAPETRRQDQEPDGREPGLGHLRVV